MENKSPRLRSFLYIVLGILIDIESLWWDFCGLIIWPIKFLRGRIALRIQRLPK